MARKTPKRDLYQEVTDKIVAMLEAGIGGDWMKPWRAAAGHGLPSNAVTHRTYRGVNVLTLWAAAMESGYPSNEWASFNQWRSRDCMVRKGEHGEQVVFFKTIERKDEDDPEEKRKIPLLRYSTVFNAVQVDGYDPPSLDEPEDPEWELDAACEALVENTGAIVREWAGDRAYYNHTKDEVVIPKAGQFASIEARYSVLFHELTHWSGHEKRLARDLRNRFGSQAYAAEELVAELGAAFLCGALGLEPEPREDHAKYVAHWGELLRGDKRAIFTAAARASDAADYLQETNREAAFDRLEGATA